MKSKKRHIKRGIALSAKKQDVYYKPFVRCCIILLAGILIPQYFQIYYLEYTFLYMVVIPICILSGLYFKFIKKTPKRTFVHIAMGGVLHNIYIVHDCKPYIYKHTALTFFYIRD